MGVTSYNSHQGQRHCQHRSVAEQADAGVDDKAGLPEQPLGPAAEYRVRGGGQPF